MTQALRRRTISPGQGILYTYIVYYNSVGDPGMTPPSNQLSEVLEGECRLHFGSLFLIADGSDVCVVVLGNGGYQLPLAVVRGHPFAFWEVGDVYTVYLILAYSLLYIYI